MRLELRQGKKEQGWWKKVLWSDELRCGIWDSDGHVCTGCIPGERYLPEGVVLKVKFGGE